MMSAFPENPRPPNDARWVHLGGARPELSAWLAQVRERLSGAEQCRSEVGPLIAAIDGARWTSGGAQLLLEGARARFLAEQMRRAGAREDIAVTTGAPPRIEGVLLPGHYELPGSPGDLHVVPVSGGADSTVMAIVMARLFPETKFIYLFTDTEAEDPNIPENLARLEKYLDRPIRHVHPERGLYPLIEKWGGFLPGHNSRYCTRELKLAPFEATMAQLRPTNGVIHSYVGIRADEAGARTGLISHHDWIETHTPFVELGVARSQVFAVLDKTVGVPAMYQYRSRSGCVVCPFQRRAELIQSALRYPEHWQRGGAAEKLTAEDQRRYAPRALSVHEELGHPHNPTFPIPKRIDARTARQAKPSEWLPSRRTVEPSASLFGEQAELFVGAEFFVDPGVGDHGVWMQRLVTYSRTRAGLAKALNYHYQMRLQAPEAWGLDEAQMREELKYAIYRLLLPAEVVDVKAPSGQSYTWQGGEAYAQVEQVLAAVTRCLEIAGLRQEAADYAEARPGTWANEHYEALKEAEAKLRAPPGEVVAMDLYEPNERAPQTEERHVACFHCSI